MLESFYNTFGFIGSLFVALFIFLLAILWVTGLAGICGEDFQHRHKTLIIILSALFPPLPLVWMIVEIFRQHRLLNQLED
ncbi:MAG: hypothetical protein ACFCU6_00145 [Balneolaceae bacterium]